jgi:hypothetical protein
VKIQLLPFTVKRGILSNSSKTKFQLWLDDETLARWKEQVPARGLTRFIIEAVEKALAEPDLPTVPGKTGLTPVSRVSELSISRPTPKKTRFDSACRNRAYHWKGFCKFCGGS